MSGGLVNESDIQSYTTDDAITYAGSIIAFATTANHVMLCGTSDKPIGYAFVSTKHPITEVAQADVKVSIGAFKPGIIIEVPLPASHATIAWGDELETAESGCVIKKSGAGEIIGTALAAVAGNTGGFIKLRVNKYTAAS